MDYTGLPQYESELVLMDLSSGVLQCSKHGHTVLQCMTRSCRRAKWARCCMPGDVSNIGRHRYWYFWAPQSVIYHRWIAKKVDYERFEHSSISEEEGILANKMASAFTVEATTLLYARDVALRNQHHPM